jgi:hypothetical protein
VLSGKWSARVNEIWGKVTRGIEIRGNVTRGNVFSGERSSKKSDSGKRAFGEMVCG